VTLGAFLTALLATLAATPPIRALARRLRLVDHPNERSLHRVVTPRAGGVAILVGLLAAVLMAQPAPWGRGFLAVAAGALLVVTAGVLDDRFSLPPWPRLVCHVVAASMVVAAAGGLDRLPLPQPLDLPLGSFGDILGVLWIVAVLNFTNFMDGIDGLAVLHGAIAAAALGLALGGVDGGAAAVAGALAGACLGLLPYNWSPASVFLGDAGSGLVGYTLAALPFLVSTESRSEMVWLVGVTLFVFLADALTCLLRRMGQGRRWYQAHREHLYQRWVGAGVPHWTVTVWLGLAALVLGSAALAGRDGNGAPSGRWAALAIGVAMVAGEWVVVRRLERTVTREP
jgi:UDP-N-acetylmuramyl pentapeptide phosphotransferase/UDP-N-acetylglucosamine-1-phosphate transferase